MTLRYVLPLVLLLFGCVSRSTPSTGGTTAGGTTAGGTTAGGTTAGGTTAGGTTAGGTTTGSSDAGLCPHDDCTAGVKLDAACDSCAAQICAADNYCCTNRWSTQCVAEVSSICGQSSCGGGTSTTGSTGTTGTTGTTGGTAPRNASCTPSSQWTGRLINSHHGRLDGTLVYVLPVGGSGKCNGDGNHVHLQVEVAGLVYDVAVDIGASSDEVGLYQDTVTLPGGAWSEGWHGSDDLSYTSLQLKSSMFPTAAPSSVASQLESLLANTSKISIFCTGYTPGDNGCHDVHYQNGSSTDGAIVLDPTLSPAPMLFFRFSGQSF